MPTNFSSDMRDSFYRRVNDALLKIGIEWPGGAENMQIRRTRAGRHQKARGALSWFLYGKDGYLPIKDIGGYVAAKYYVGELEAMDERYAVVIEPIKKTEGGAKVGKKKE